MPGFASVFWKIKYLLFFCSNSSGFIFMNYYVCNNILAMQLFKKFPTEQLLFLFFWPIPTHQLNRLSHTSYYCSYQTMIIRISRVSSKSHEASDSIIKVWTCTLHTRWTLFCCTTQEPTNKTLYVNVWLIHTIIFHNHFILVSTVHEAGTHLEWNNFF